MLNHVNAQVELFRTACTVGLPILDSVFLKRARTANGTSGVDIATGADNETVVGIAHVRAVAQRCSTIIDQQHVVDATRSIILPRVPVHGSVKVFNTTTDKAVDKANVTVSGAKVTFKDTDASDKDIVTVTYRYTLSMLELQAQGLPIDFANQITGNDGEVEFATGRICVELDNFDIEADYTVDDDIYVSPEGLATTVKHGKPIAKVSSEPTAANPVLGISGVFNF